MCAGRNQRHKDRRLAGLTRYSGVEFPVNTKLIMSFIFGVVALSVAGCSLTRHKNHQANLRCTGHTK